MICQKENPYKSPVIYFKIYVDKYPISSPNVMFICTKLPNIPDIGTGAISLRIKGVTELNIPTQMPWQKRKKRNE